MELALMMIFLISFTTVTTEKQKVGEKSEKEIVEPLGFPQPPPIFYRVEKIERMETPVNNDAEIFWEVTKPPKLGTTDDFVNGNHPKSDEKTTHYHVDEVIGHVPPTKRVKKILPPFEKRKMRNVRHVEITTEKPEESLTDFLSDKKSTNLFLINSEFLSTNTILTDGTGASDDTTEFSGATVPTRETTPKDETLYKVHNAEFFSSGDNGEIQGIRLVPDESGILTPGEGENNEGEGGQMDEESSMQKTIWDLLKEREEFNMHENHLDMVDELENPKNDTPTEMPAGSTKSLYEHFDADSAQVEFETENFNKGSNIEKHELPFSYAVSWLRMKDKGSNLRKKPEENEESFKKVDVPIDISNLLRLTENEKSVNGVTVSIINSGNNEYMRYGHRPSKWYLLLLTGNSTIVKLRQKDFTKYLKLNLAARLSVEYDDVKVNKVILAPPKVLVNISVFAPSDDVAEESQMDLKERMAEKGEAPLYKLAETNATLLELSGEEFHVVRFLSLETQKPEAEAQKDSLPMTVASRHDDLEFVIYTFLGSACACGFLLTLFVTLNRHFKKTPDFDWPWFRPKQGTWKIHEGESEKDEFNGVSPAVIYSGGFPQIRGSWMTGSAPKVMPPTRNQFQGIELDGSPPYRRPPLTYSNLEDKPCSSPRHSKLQIYNCDANSLVIPLPVSNKTTAKVKPDKNEGTDAHPLDVRLRGEKTGQDNPIFTN